MNDETPRKETIRVNGLTLCHKHSDGFVRSTLPDVCRTPSAGNQPVPYDNVAYARDLENGTRTVFSHGGAMNGVKGSYFARSCGDEPGASGGVKSGTHMGKATFLTWSPTVFMEGRPVARLTDKMLLNDGNTISAGGYYTGQVPPGQDKATLNYLCQLACECIEAGTPFQSCVEKKLVEARLAEEVIALAAYLWPEVTFDGAGGFRLKRGSDFPSRQRGLPGARPDVTGFSEGRPRAFYEMKFKGDRFRGDQLKDYRRLAEQTGATFKDIDIEKDCDCSGGGGEGSKQPVLVPVPGTKEHEESSFVQDHPYLTTAGIVVLAAGAAALTWYAGGSGGAAVLATFGGGVLAATGG